MWNFEAIDKTPTVKQVKAIINYMENDENLKYDFALMMGMERPSPNVIEIDLNNAHFGVTYKIIFNDDVEIVSFEKTGVWMS